MRIIVPLAKNVLLPAGFSAADSTTNERMQEKRHILQSLFYSSFLIYPTKPFILIFFELSLLNLVTTPLGKIHRKKSFEVWLDVCRHIYCLAVGILYQIRILNFTASL